MLICIVIFNFLFIEKNYKAKSVLIDININITIPTSKILITIFSLKNTIFPVTSVASTTSAVL